MADEKIGDAEEAYVEAVAMCGKLQEPLRSEMVAAIDRLQESYNWELSESQKALDKQVADLEAAFDHDMAFIRDELERPQQEHPPTYNKRAFALALLWSDSDGRRILMRAYIASPRETVMMLNYMGAHQIAGELRETTSH